MRIGIFGGTFDPPHVGHLLVAQEALAVLALDRLVFVPAAQQPLKVGHGAAPAEARLEMVRRTVLGVPRISCDAIEVDRSGLSYSVDTLAEYARRFPADELFFLLGLDAARSLPSWRQPRRLAQRQAQTIRHRINRCAPAFGHDFALWVEARRTFFAQLIGAPDKLRAGLRGSLFSGDFAQTAKRANVIRENLNRNCQ